MLFWEALHDINGHHRPSTAGGPNAPVHVVRLPYDRRCAAITKAGTRCRGRIRKGSEFCFCHDPELTVERRRRMSEKGARQRRRLSHLPDGYLRKLKSRAAIGEAMDRLYRELRTGAVSVDMGTVMYGILSRLLDSDLIPAGQCPQRSRAAKIQPKLAELLTRNERAALKQAIAKESTASDDARSLPMRTAPFERATAQRRRERRSDARPAVRSLQAAS